jgi:predicted ATP-dependent endonuclease of OLD family
MQKIVVENFGPIKHAEIELRDFVVLIGEQASGKSTIGKLVYFFNSLNEEFVSIASQAQTHILSEILRDLSKATSQKFVRYFGFPALLPEFKIRFYFSLEADKWVELSLRKEGTVKSTIHTIYNPAFLEDYNLNFNSLWKKFQEVSDSMKIQETDTEEIKKQKITLQYLMIKETGDRIYNLRPDSIYFPASRNISIQFSNLFKQSFYGSIVTRLDSSNAHLFNVADWILMKAFLEHSASIRDSLSPHKTFENMLDEFSKTEAKFNKSAIDVFLKNYVKVLKGKYVLNNDGERIVYGEDSQNSILVENSSSGQQESLRMLQDIFLILMNNADVLRIIEEPEAHLFPNAQKYLMELFALVSNATNSQVFITTHSPYVLSVLANLLYAKKVEQLGAGSASEITEKTGLHEKTWLDKDRFAAYTMDSGNSKSIFDRENTGLIDQNFLDQISEDLGKEFNILYKMRAKELKNAK